MALKHIRRAGSSDETDAISEQIRSEVFKIPVIRNTFFAVTFRENDFSYKYDICYRLSFT